MLWSLNDPREKLKVPWRISRGSRAFGPIGILIGAISALKKGRILVACSRGYAPAATRGKAAIGGISPGYHYSPNIGTLPILGVHLRAEGAG